MWQESLGLGQVSRQCGVCKTRHHCISYFNCTRIEKYQMVWTKPSHCQAGSYFLSGWCSHTKKYGGTGIHTLSDSYLKLRIKLEHVEAGVIMTQFSIKYCINSVTGLLCFSFTLLCNLSRKLTPLFQPIGCETKTNYYQIANIFPCFRQFG